MAKPAAGDYYIIPVTNTSKGLDVSGNDGSNGSNVQIFARNVTNMQIWELSYRSDGTAQIASKFTGKCLDIPSAYMVSGANVQMYDDNDTRAQTWLIEEKSTITISGATYPTYEVYLSADTNLCMDVVGAGTTDGVNVWVYNRNNTNAQRWVFMPTPTPAEGDYYIIPVTNTSKALDVSGNNRNNGANVQIYARNLTDAQVWRLTYRPNGTAQITSRFTGKSLDIPGANLVSGANVQMYTDNDTRAQEWRLAEKSTATISGITYKTYEIYLAHATTLCMDVVGAGTTDGTNVWVYTRNNTNAQRWVLMPTPAYHSGGIYEIKSQLNPKMNVDVAGASTANGANVQLYSDNNTNAQKFIFVNEGNGWSIRNVASGKYVDVNGANFRNGTNVQSWVDNDTRAQRWSVTTYGTQVVDGVACQIVALGADNGQSYFMDVTSGLASTGRNIQIYQDNDTRAQRFVLFPTWAIDPYMPSPHTLGFGSSLFSAVYSGYACTSVNGTVTKTYYPSWKCADAWATSGPNSYQWRYRYRYMSSTTSTWGSWGGWSSWLTAQVTRSGDRSSVTAGLPVNFNLKSAKVCQIQFEVRSCGTGALSLLYGATASNTTTFYFCQNISLGEGAWSPDGIRIACSSDYDKGVTHIYVKSVKWDGKEMLKSEVACKQLDDSTSFLIPQANLRGIPAANQTITVQFDYGTDQYARFGGVTQTRTVSLNYNTGTAEDVTFSKVDPDSLHLQASVNNIGTTKMWVVSDGESHELTRVKVSGSKWVYDVPYPFTRDYEVIVSGTSSDEDRFYTTRVKRNKEKHTAHAWYMKDGTNVIVNLREGEPLVTESSVESIHQVHTLNARAWETVTFAETRKSTFTVKGALAKDVSEATYQDIEAMVGQHLKYRSPSGDICNVAVLSCKRVSHSQWDEIDVSMIRETI